MVAEEDPDVHLGQLKRFSLRELQVASDGHSNKKHSRKRRVRESLQGPFRQTEHLLLSRDRRRSVPQVERVVEGEEARDVGGTRSSNELEQVIQVALLCTQGSPMETTKDVRLFVRMLEGDGLA
uniref:Uncharacterized protein n=1 Tax=Brassica campestris TaxID=3711 RepID=M4CUU1_BRACM